MNELRWDNSCKVQVLSKDPRIDCYQKGFRSMVYKNFDNTFGEIHHLINEMLTNKILVD